MSRLWWENTAEYWNLPFYSEAGMTCEAQLKRSDELAGREQLWGIRELNEEPGEIVPGFTKDENGEVIEEFESVTAQDATKPGSEAAKAQLPCGVPSLGKSRRISFPGKTVAAVPPTLSALEAPNKKQGENENDD